ncbi:MAG: hypothetical protein WHS65_12720 [Melioribacteraceae bacterium]
MAELDTTYIDLSNTNEVIDLEFIDDEKIEIKSVDNVNIYEGFGSCYIYQLSQVDIDNKFIIISDLSTVSDKKNILITIDNASFICEYLVDYIIDNEGKISWNGLGLEDKLQVGDKIKVYY